MPPPPLPMTTPAFGLADAQPGVGPGLARGDDADQRGARVALGIGAVAGVRRSSSPSSARHVVDRHAGDRRRDAAREVRRVELGDGARAAAAAADALPEPLAADAERRDDADAGDHDRAVVLALGDYTRCPSQSAMTIARLFVWLGGAVFVGSLLVCVWWFVAVLTVRRRQLVRRRGSECAAVLGVCRASQRVRPREREAVARRRGSR